MSHSSQNNFIEGYVGGKLRKIKQIDGTFIVEEPIEKNFTIKASAKLKIQDITALNTSSDGDLLSNASFDTAPMSGSHVYMILNTAIIVAANGSTDAANKPFYITDCTGTIIRAQGSFEIGDLFHWNGSIANYQIETTDSIKIAYMTT